MIPPTRRRFVPGAARALVMTLVVCSLAIGCSDSTGPEPTPEAKLSVTPDSGSPGTVVEIQNLNISGIDVDSLRVYFGDRMAPVIRSESGALLTSIPLFLDESGVHTPPTSPVDVVIKEIDREIGLASAAVTVLSLPQAPGEARRVVTEMKNVADALETIMGGLIVDPGREEQFVTGLFAALDSLLGDTGESSFGAAVTSVEADPDQLAILEGVLAVNHAADHLASIASELQDIATQLGACTADPMYETTPFAPQNTAAATALAVSDDLLALKMQFYVIASDFGEQVIAETGQTFAETVGLAAGLVGIAYSIPQVEVTLVILAYLDFVVNKVIVGLLPADLDSIDLTLANNELDFLTQTDATITVNASNNPPQISLQYMIGQVLTLMGASGSSEAIQSFKDVLIRTANYFLSTMQGVIASYSSDHPELNLDVDLFSVVPTITWRAAAANPAYYDLKTFTPNIIEPLIEDLNWVTKEEIGVGRVYVMPSSSEDARILPGYYGGAFGNGSVASAVLSVIVGANLELEVVCPGAMNHGDTEGLSIRVGYREATEINWTSGINVTVDVQHGSVSPASGITDDTGYFTADIHADEVDADVMELVIDARGDNETFGGTTFEIALGKGLPAYYSNGAYAMEGPIDHGWDYSCGGSLYENNKYQGACTPLGASPVDWASGGWVGEEDPTAFWAYWTGYIYAPVDGSYRFSGWIDGNVIIEVDGTRIVRAETPGSTVSGYVTLAGETWVPIFIYFETNGGSNNMNLRWLVPGGVGEVVPRKYLNDEAGDAPTMAPARPSNVKVIRRL